MLLENNKVIVETSNVVVNMLVFLYKFLLFL